MKITTILVAAALVVGGFDSSNAGPCGDKGGGFLRYQVRYYHYSTFKSEVLRLNGHLYVYYEDGNGNLVPVEDFDFESRTTLDADGVALFDIPYVSALASGFYVFQGYGNVSFVTDTQKKYINLARIDTKTCISFPPGTLFLDQLLALDYNLTFNNRKEPPINPFP